MRGKEKFSYIFCLILVIFYFLIEQHSLSVFYICLSISLICFLPTILNLQKSFPAPARSLPSSLTNTNSFFRFSLKAILNRSLPDLLRVGQISAEYSHNKFFSSFTTLTGCLNYISSSIMIWLPHVLLMKARTLKVRTTGVSAQRYSRYQKNVYEGGQLINSSFICSIHSFIYMHLMNSFCHSFLVSIYRETTW